ncbi:MAG: hypothetical protein JXA18_13265 [Chitinispirillaceae bacterium]|nr:hypothetical protein [Chitinispirillaceae bacterium]
MDLYQALATGTVPRMGREKYVVAFIVYPPVDFVDPHLSLKCVRQSDCDKSV